MFKKFQKIAESQPDVMAREIIPAGTYIGYCCAIVDLGNQKTKWKDEETKISYQIHITWELCDLLRTFEKDGKTVEKPLVKGVTYNFVFGDKSNLQKHLSGWFGRKIKKDEFSEDLILGKYCMITVAHEISEKNGNTYEKIAGIAQLHHSITPPRGVNELVSYSIECDKDNELFLNLPKFLREKIEQSDEFKKYALENEQVPPPPPPNYQNEQVPPPPPPKSPGF